MERLNKDKQSADSETANGRTRSSAASRFASPLSGYSRAVGATLATLLYMAAIGGVSYSLGRAKWVNIKPMRAWPNVP